MKRNEQITEAQTPAQVGESKNDGVQDSRDRLLTPIEVGEILHIDEQTVRKHLRGGSLEGYQVGGVWRIKRSAVDAFLEASKNRPSVE